MSYYVLEHDDGSSPSRLFRLVETAEAAYFQMWSGQEWALIEDRDLEVLRLDGWDYRGIEEDEAAGRGALGPEL